MTGDSLFNGNNTTDSDTNYYIIVGSAFVGHQKAGSGAEFFGRFLGSWQSIGIYSSKLIDDSSSI
ncbi:MULTISPECIES: hypothetical protein [unclassified Microcoleus]|uniref:hypothetical protein n=1 Tax=unclassified Microcoleus TaxID=2642155 RepID=UPI002FCE7965